MHARWVLAEASPNPCGVGCTKSWGPSAAEDVGAVRMGDLVHYDKPKAFPPALAFLKSCANVHEKPSGNRGVQGEEEEAT